MSLNIYDAQNDELKPAAGVPWTAVNKMESHTFVVEIPASGWELANEVYTKTVTVLGLTCGKDGLTPPIIQCTSNQTDYNEVTDAQADGTAHTITFTARKQPANMMIVRVIDVH